MEVIQRFIVKDRLLKHSILLIILVVSAAASANLVLNDDALSEQTDQLKKLTPEVITQVKSEVDLNIEQQNQAQLSLAQARSGQIKQQLLESNAVSDYEIKRKTDPEKLLQVEKHEFIPVKQSQVIYRIDYENKNVQLGNNLK